MKLIVAGGRDFNDYERLKSYLTQLNPTEIVSGTARGADSLGEQYALENDIDIIAFPADWETYGKRAGFIRNTEMAHYADRLIAFWDNQSKGTKHMIDIMRKLQKPVVIVDYNIICLEDEWN